MNETGEMIKRRNDLLRQGRNIIGIGLAYYAITSTTGLYIPCVFRLLTGLKCPGCGVTHLAVAMLHGNIHEAFMANQLIFVLLPIAAIYGCYRANIYVRSGRRDFGNLETILLILTLMATIAFGIYRNI